MMPYKPGCKSMDDFYEKAASFLEQQIELYGDELVMEVAAHNPDAREGSDRDADEWRQSTSLIDLEKQISACRKCALYNTRNKFVFGSGNPNADIVLVGEAPGADEDRLGQPFVGRAGELLTKMLAAIDLQRSSVYICNILKCRPPQNRDPAPDEIVACKPYLMKQLQLIRPKIIVCLGRIAAQVLLETTDSLSRLRGQIHRFNESELHILYHPAALLRNPSLKRDAWEDLKRIQRSLLELKVK